MKWFVKMALLVVVGLGGCKGCDEKVDPCANQKPTTANFKVWERSWGTRGEQFMEWYPQWQDIDSDTIAIAAFVAEAEEPENPTDSVTYRWEVGSEILTTRKISRSIFSGPLPPFIDLKLTVTKKPNRNCNPTDPGTATYSRRIFLAKELKWVGIWHGYINDNPADTLTVYIVPGNDSSEPAPCRPWLSIGHFPLRGWYLMFDGGISYEQFGRLGGGSCLAPLDQSWVPGNMSYGIVNRKTRQLTINSTLFRRENGNDVESKKIKFTGIKVK
jgi:hypothetical protein